MPMPMPMPMPMAKNETGALPKQDAGLTSTNLNA